jgi:hypothetical protein
MFEDPTGKFQILSGEYSRLEQIFEESGYTTDQLNHKEKTFLLVYMTDSAINSDGIFSLWFNNHGLLDTPDVPKAFQEIGAPVSARIIEEFVRHAQNTPCPQNLQERAEHADDLCKDWPDSEELDQEYYGKEEDIDSLLISFLSKK